ncbi:MAG: fumarylacetoacetate hydrolase family protein [Bacteroidota bacterium]
MNIKRFLLLSLFLLLGGLAYYLFRPLSGIPDPAAFTCHELSEGYFLARDSLPAPQHILGMGLTYSDHLKETSASFDPKALPPIFLKQVSSMTGHETKVALPDMKEMLAAISALEPEVAEKVEHDFPEMGPLLDYEVELGFVLLADISREELQDENFVPPIGFFLANDLSARSLALLGEGSSKRYAYWGASKSFPGFTPMTDQVWIPHEPQPNSLPCIRLETFVNGEQRQSQTTENMIYTPAQMLAFIQQKYPDLSLKRGDMILMGTPGGVAIGTPRALVRLSSLLGFDRYRKLSVKLGGDQALFLKRGDEVEIRGEGLGRVKISVGE